jgi:hypothetical protein
MRSACVQTVDSLGMVCGRFVGLLHRPFAAAFSTWKTSLTNPALYTECTQQSTGAVGISTSVNVRLYTVFTGLTKTTTNSNILF